MSLTNVILKWQWKNAIVCHSKWILIGITHDHTYSGCQVNFTRDFFIICNEKYKSPDCINEYYSFGTTQDTNFNDRFSQEYLQLLIKSINWSNIPNIKLRENDTNLVSFVNIVYNDEPETIYHHFQRGYLLTVVGVQTLCFTHFFIDYHFCHTFEG